MADDPNKPVTGAQDAQPDNPAPDAAADDAPPDWVRDPAKAYEEIRRVRAEAKAEREKRSAIEKAQSDAMKAADKAARDAELKALADEKNYAPLVSKLQAERDAALAQVAQREFDDQRRDIAEAAGLPAGSWKRLMGTTADELKADAQSLRELLAPVPTPPAPGQRPGTTPAPSGRAQGVTDEQRRARLKGQTGASIFDKREG